MKLFLIRLLNKVGLLQYLIFNVTTQIYSIKFTIPLIKGIGLKNIITTEPWMVNLLQKLLPITNDDVFIDIGVNIGQTLLKLKAVNKEMTYVGFEPNPSAVFYTNELIKANRFKNTSLIPVGLNNKTEVLTLNIYNSSDVDPSASILTEFRPSQKVVQEVNIPVFNVNELSNLKPTLEKVSILKIDVEGAELEVLQSLETIIKTATPFILMEILPVYNTENRYRIERQEKIEILLSQLDYSIYRIIKSKSISFERIESIEVHSDIDKCDYIFVPNNKVTAFSNLPK